MFAKCKSFPFYRASAQFTQNGKILWKARGTAPATPAVSHGGGAFHGAREPKCSPIQQYFSMGKKVKRRSFFRHRVCPSHDASLFLSRESVTAEQTLYLCLSQEQGFEACWHPVYPKMYVWLTGLCIKGVRMCWERHSSGALMHVDWDDV